MTGTCAGWCGSPTAGSPPPPTASLARAGRYREVEGNLRVKEVCVSPGGGTADGARSERFVICHNPDPAARDAAVREHLIEHLEGLIAGYKQLIAVERGWRDCKGSLGLRLVHHYREDHIRAHVQLCWLALLLIRVVETTTSDTWRNLRHELDRMHLVTLATADGRVAQRFATTSGQTILTTLDLPEPPKYFEFNATTS